MTDPDLAAFVPTNEVDARRIDWKQMPYQDILTALAARTNGRMVRADDLLSRKDLDAGELPGPPGSAVGIRTGQSDANMQLACPYVEFDLA